MRIRWTAGAVVNLSALRAFIEEDRSTLTAQREVRKLFFAIDRLVQFPNSGRAGRVAGTRELVVAPYIVAYRIRGDAVEILRVLHGAQRWPETMS